MRPSLLPAELLVFLFSASVNVRHAIASPSVNVALQASFNAPPYILELLETAAEENSTAYFPLLDRIAEGRFADCSTDQELYNTFLEVLEDDGHIRDPDALSSFQLALSIHSAAPRIEAHYHYYDTSVQPSLIVAQDAACPVWVHFLEKQYCSPTLDRAQQDVGSLKNPERLPFDRVLGEQSDANVPPPILYADITSPLFGQFHQTMSNAARNRQNSYRIRYRPSTSQEAKPLAVNGYGVELALKRTDYIVIDDRSDGAEGAEGTEDRGPSLGNEADAVEDSGASAIKSLLDAEEVSDLKPLSAKELSGLGLKTGSFIMASEDPLETLLKVSQDFPKHSSTITKRNASRDFVKEHLSNRELFLPAGYNVIWMNGQQVQGRQMDAFGLLEQLRRERSIAGNLRRLGLSGSEAVQVLSHPAIADAKMNTDSQRYDYRDEIEGGKVIIWLNDIEKDKRYNSWPAHASALLQRTFPGQLPQVRRDIHNVMLPLDLSDVKDVELLVESLQAFVKRKIPIRFGIVPLTTSEAAINQAKVVYHLLDTYGLSAVLAYLEVSASGKRVALATKATFESIIQKRAVRADRVASDFQSVLQAEESRQRLEKTQAYLKRLGADETPAPLFANGVAMPRNDAWLQVMSQNIDTDLRSLQRQVYEEMIPEDTWLAGQFLVKAITHRNALIIPEDELSIKIIDMGSLASKYRDIFETIPRVLPETEGEPTDSITAQLMIIANLDSQEGSDLVASASVFCKEHGNVELLLIHNADVPGDFPQSVLVAEMVKQTGRDLDTRALETSMNLNRPLSDEQLALLKKDKLSPEAVERAKHFWRTIHPVIQAFGLEPGQHAIVVNGRVVGPVPKRTAFTASDFEQLLDFERSKRLGPAHTALTAVLPEMRLRSALDAAILSSTIALSTESDIPEGIFESAPTLRMDKFVNWTGDYTMIQTGDADTSSIHLVVSIDPTSQIAQRWLPILQVLSELNGVHLKMYINPREKMQELPIKRFYRHVLDAKPSFRDNGEVRSLQATFDKLPKDALLNLALDVPPAWLVAPKESVHDLDNIKLSLLKEGDNVDAVYELEHILIEGHSRDVTVGPPPRGVQLYLGTEKDPHFADTIIMANLGYFQFKANPGYWKLQLQPGRSSQIFNIDSAGQLGYNPQKGDSSTDITLMSFQGKTLYPRLSRKPGMETEDVLEESISSSPYHYLTRASKIATSLLSSLGLAPSRTQNADINIFSVASGHLYERMLNIMMVSVLRHTTHSVKFWFIAQFLSPSFKASLPYLAAHYNFQYELITYKWPHWLRAQSEKQREIWGYKILFLDVLFPTSLDKVIFVDADQIVRTDMYDLVTLDLEGAAYGFTPMCDSRTEMEGFRFWKQGYWANFLRGKPYHISALYVVDLIKFREIAAGDRLRQQYHQLSADPGSLSNLDQDLPNHMQHVLPLKSLPQEWLWCETWCSDESLKEARTIDLCNNPLTKEPKLSRARRQVPEWTVYDDEIRGVLRQSSSGGGGEEGSKVVGGKGESVQERMQREEEERVKRQGGREGGRRDEL